MWPKCLRKNGHFSATIHFAGSNTMMCDIKLTFKGNPLWVWFKYRHHHVAWKIPFLMIPKSSLSDKNWPSYKATHSSHFLSKLVWHHEIIDISNWSYQLMTSLMDPIIMTSLFICIFFDVLCKCNKYVQTHANKVISVTIVWHQLSSELSQPELSSPLLARTPDTLMYWAGLSWRWLTQTQLGPAHSAQLSCELSSRSKSSAPSPASWVSLSWAESWGLGSSARSAQAQLRWAELELGWH